MEKIVDGLKDDEPFLDSVLMHMGSAYSILGRPQKSMLMYQRALEILEITYGNLKKIESQLLPIHYVSIDVFA